MKLTIQEKMRRDWDRRAKVDPFYWVAATQEADQESYQSSAEKDCLAFMRGLEAHLDPPTGDLYAGRLVDLGCGIGRMSAGLKGAFEEVVGVDVSAEMIKQARALHQADGLSFEVNSGADLSLFDDESVRVVCSYSVLPHLPADVVEAYFIECGRILSQGGLFRYQFWVGDALHPREDDSLNIHVYDEESLQRLHALGGFEILDREEIDYLDPVLKIKPCWITARRQARPETRAALQREVSGALSDEERRLEYELCLYLAMKHSERGERMEAEAVLERAAQLDPDREEAYLHWAELRLSGDDLRGALLLLETLTERRPSLPLPWFQRGLLEEAVGALKQAKESLKRAIQEAESPHEDADLEEMSELRAQAKSALRRVDRARLKRR